MLLDLLPEVGHVRPVTPVDGQSPAPLSRRFLSVPVGFHASELVKSRCCPSTGLESLFLGEKTLWFSFKPSSKTRCRLMPISQLGPWKLCCLDGQVRSSGARVAFVVTIPDDSSVHRMPCRHHLPDVGMWLCQNRGLKWNPGKWKEYKTCVTLGF